MMRKMLLGTLEQKSFGNNAMRWTAQPDAKQVPDKLSDVIFACGGKRTPCQHAR